LSFGSGALVHAIVVVVYLRCGNKSSRSVRSATDCLVEGRQKKGNIYNRFIIIIIDVPLEPYFHQLISNKIKL
jgi:hypothetical protein